MFNKMTRSRLLIRYETERLVIRTPNQHDALLLTDYYQQNQDYLKPWEPSRDHSYRSMAGWQVRLIMLNEQLARGELFYFILLDKKETEVIGIINFSNIIRGDFQACYLGYSLAMKYQGLGVMYEALQLTIGYVFSRQNMHRIMANYMPHNQRSGNLLAKLGFEREGYAKNYLCIDGQWQDHILTALTNRDWRTQV